MVKNLSCEHAGSAFSWDLQPRQGAIPTPQVESGLALCGRKMIFFRGPYTTLALLSFQKLVFWGPGRGRENISPQVRLR